VSAINRIMSLRTQHWVILIWWSAHPKNAAVSVQVPQSNSVTPDMGYRNIIIKPKHNR